MIYILHISDLHFVKNAAAYHTKEILCKEAKEKLKDIPKGQKLLVVTGDFHNFIDADYSEAQSFLKELVRNMGISMRRDVFVVPGNHDVGNDDALKPLLEKDDPDWKNHRVEYVKKLKGKDMSYIPSRLPVFLPYINFISQLGICNTAKDPFKPAQTYLRKWRGKLIILHLNTALVADGHTKKRLITDTDTAAKPEAWKGFDSKKIPVIAIAHNSFYDLRKSNRDELATTFSLRNVSAYLSGDRHRIVSDSEEQMIRLASGFREGEEIPNLVAAKVIADRKDNYSDVGFCWHEWDENTGKVRVEFRKWTSENRAGTVLGGDPGEYVMRGFNPNKPDSNIETSLVQETMNSQENETLNLANEARNAKYNQIITDMMHWLISLPVRWGPCENSTEEQHANTCEGLLAMKLSGYDKKRDNCYLLSWNILMQEKTDQGLSSKSLRQETVVCTSMLLLLAAKERNTLSEKEKGDFERIAQNLWSSRNEEYGWGVYIGLTERSNCSYTNTAWALRALMEYNSIRETEDYAKFCHQMFESANKGKFSFAYKEKPKLIVTSMYVAIFYRMDNAWKEEQQKIKGFDLKEAVQFIYHEFVELNIQAEQETVYGLDLNGIGPKKAPWTHVTVWAALDALSQAYLAKELEEKEWQSVLAHVDEIIGKNIRRVGETVFYHPEGMEESRTGNYTFPTAYLIMGLSELLKAGV